MSDDVCAKFRSDGPAPEGGGRVHTTITIVILLTQSCLCKVT